jgi:hypothetical protein
MTVLMGTRLWELSSGLSEEVVTWSWTINTSAATGSPRPERLAKSWTSKSMRSDGLALMSAAQAVQLKAAAPGWAEGGL